MNSLISMIKDWFRTCPVLDDKRIDIDCLGETPGQFSVDGEPTELIVTRYFDGSTVRRLSFSIASRSYYGEDIADQDANLAAFERLCEWLEMQRLYRRWPDLGDGRRVRSLRPTTTAYPVLVDADTGTARYQMGCELIYFQEVKYEA